MGRARGPGRTRADHLPFDVLSVERFAQPIYSNPTQPAADSYTRDSPKNPDQRLSWLDDASGFYGHS